MHNYGWTTLSTTCNTTTLAATVFDPIAATQKSRRTTEASRPNYVLYACQPRVYLLHNLIVYNIIINEIIPQSNVNLFLHT